MSETANKEGGTSAESEKPVQDVDVIFPPFPDPTEEEFEEDISDTERNHYRTKFSDLNLIKTMRLHCTACDRHLGSSTRNESRMRAHPMLRTLVCHTCHTFYNSGEFEKGDDGSELYCRWCGQGGQVYCCSDCPHVFCAKCIKRNLGAAKIKEIENTDDWKCFKCNPKCLWDVRAVCWALLRYCDLKNKITYKTEDPELKEKYQKDCATDHSECCKYKASRRKEKTETIKKKDEIKKENETKKAISKIPSTIQVKKFASINIDDQPKEKKAQKRPLSQDNKGLLIIKNPITIAPCQKNFSPNILCGPPAKKPRMPVVNPVRFAQDRKAVTSYTRIRPKPPSMPIPIPPLVPTNFNGFHNLNNSFMNNTFHNSYNNINNMMAADNINLSLESLTQGLDMSAVANNMNSGPDDDVVCTPDFPLEPLCEVTEDNTDDDVQCITPGPVVAPKVNTQPLVPRLENALPDLSPENIIQMTDNDVTVNAVTGGLKFRVDPQTLSSNKMYRLPDGRIFAIKANPNMPGGYSATIVAVTDAGQGKVAPKGATYAAKLSAVTSSQTSTTSIKTSRSNQNQRLSNTKRSTPKSAKVNRGTDTSSRECDLHVPVEWYRYNLIDAIDAVEYSLSRLNKLKKEATTVYLRTRTVEEMRNLHKSLERLLNTSSTRFMEIKDNLNKELKQYISKKAGGSISEDDDDVEILMPDLDNDDPIFIDENSLESTTNEINCIESQEVDLTGVGSSDHNDSAENISTVEKDPSITLGIDDSTENKEDDVSKVEKVLEGSSADDTSSAKNDSNNMSINDSVNLNEGENNDSEESKEILDSKDNDSEQKEDGTDTKTVCDKNDEQHSEDDIKNIIPLREADSGIEAQINGSIGKSAEKERSIEKRGNSGENKDKSDEETDKSDVENDKSDEEKDKNDEKKDKSDEEKDISNTVKVLLKDDDYKMLSDGNDDNDGNVKVEDPEMSEEMIETLLKHDDMDTVDSMLKSKSMEVTESI